MRPIPYRTDPTGEETGESKKVAVRGPIYEDDEETWLEVQEF